MGRFGLAGLGPEEAIWFYAAAGLAGLFALILAFRRPKTRLFLPLLPFFLLGPALILPFNRPALNQEHVFSLLGTETLLTGVVVRPPEPRPWGTYLTVAAERAYLDGQERPVTGRLRLAVPAPLVPPRYGDRLRFKARLQAVSEMANFTPGSYARYLADRRVFVRGSLVRPFQIATLPEAGGSAWWRRVEAFRERGRAIITAASARSGLLPALLAGDRSGLAREVLDTFSATSTIHLLVVSGLHLGLVAGGGYLLFRFALSRSTGLCLRGLVIPLSRGLALAPALFYALLAGFSPATWRALVLVAAGLLSGLLGRLRDVWSGLILAALILTLFWPPAPFDLSFQLSFTAVAALLVLAGRLGQREPRSLWGRVLAYCLGLPLASLATTLALAPLLARAFNQVPLAGILANVVLVPLYTLLAVPLGLVGVALGFIQTSLGRPLLALAGYLAEAGAEVVRKMAGWSLAALRVPTPTLLEVTLTYLGLVGLALLSSPRRRRLGATLLCLALAGGSADWAYWHFQNHDQRLILTVLDVGQGQSLDLRFPGGRRWLVDGGGFPGSSLDLGRLVVAPALWADKVIGLETLVLTHPHADHALGLDYVAAQFNPRTFIYPGQEVRDKTVARVLRRLQAIIPAGPGLETLLRGVRVGPVQVQALWPRSSHFTGSDAKDDLNETSLVLKISLGRARLLLPADIQEKAQQALIELHDQGRVDLKAEVIVLPHHGGRDPTTFEFLERVDPKVAVASAGVVNKFGFPDPQVEAWLKARGAEVYSTREHGAIRVAVDQGEISVRAVLPQGRPAGMWLQRMKGQRD